MKVPLVKRPRLLLDTSEVPPAKKRRPSEQSPNAGALVGLLDMPTEITRRIAGHVDPESRIELALTNTSLRTQLVNEKRAAVITTRFAPRVSTIESFRYVLSEIEALPFSLWGEPLLVLANRIEELPEANRSEATDGTLKAIEKLLIEQSSELPSIEQLSELLSTAADQIASLPGDDKLARFDRVFMVIGKLPLDHRGEPLGILADRINELPRGEVPTRFERVFEAAGELRKKHRGATLEALARQIPALPGDMVLAKFDSLFVAIGEVPEELRDESLAALADQLGSVPEAAVLDRFDSVFKAVGDLHEKHRCVPLTALAGQVSVVQGRLGSVFEAIGQLPATDRGEPLGVLDIEVDRLPAAVQPMARAAIDAMWVVASADQNAAMRGAD